LNLAVLQYPCKYAVLLRELTKPNPTQLVCRLNPWTTLSLVIFRRLWTRATCVFDVVVRTSIRHFCYFCLGTPGIL